MLSNYKSLFLTSCNNRVKLKIGIFKIFIEVFLKNIAFPVYVKILLKLSELIVHLFTGTYRPVIIENIYYRCL